MASFHNWTGDEEIDTQVPQFLNEDNTATQEKLDTKFNKSLEIAEASDLNNFKDEGFYCCNINSRAETILNCPTNYAFGLMVWGKGEIVYQEVREYNRSTNNLEYNNCWRRSYYSGEDVQGTWSKWQQMSYMATTLAEYGITDGMSKSATNSVSVADILKRNINTSYLRLTGGMAVDNSANLQLCGCNYTGDIADAGQFSLEATDSIDSAVLLGTPSGVLKWGNKNIVRSVNNSVADDDGNVNVANMAGASDSAAGKAGLVPIPTAGKQDMALCGDATFKVLPIAGGGTGANTVSAACKALGLDWEWFHRYGLNYVPSDVTNNGWNSLGLCLIYYTERKIKNQPSTYGQLLNIPAHQDQESTQIWIVQDSGALYFRGGNGFDVVNDTVFTRVATEEDVSSAGYGIVAANLAQNGYVKFANGLILQWGNSYETNRDTTVTFPIAFNALYSVVGGPKSSSNLSGSNSNFGVKSQNNWSFIANMYDNGRGYAGFNWCAFGRA